MSKIRFDGDASFADQLGAMSLSREQLDALLSVDAPAEVDKRYLFERSVRSDGRWVPVLVHRSVCPPLDDPAGITDWLRGQHAAARDRGDDGRVGYLVAWPADGRRRVWVSRTWFADPEILVIDPAPLPPVAP